MAERSGKLPGKPPPVPNKRRMSTARPTPPSPPPVPSPAPEAAIVGNTELDGGLITRRLTSSAAADVVEALRTHLSAELEALTETNADDQTIADVALRLALVNRDLSGELDLVLRDLERAKSHPLAVELLVSLAKGAANKDEFERITQLLDAQLSDASEDVASRIREELAIAWLYRFVSPERVSDIAVDGLAGGASDELKSAYAMALALQEDWGTLGAFLADGGDSKSTCRAAQIATDCTNDLAGALALVEGHANLDGDDAHYASILEAQLLAQTGASVADKAAALERRVVLLTAKAPKSAELSATRFSHAIVQEQAGEEEKAQATFAALTSKTGWSTSAAQIGALRVATHRRDWGEVANQCGKLATLAKEPELEVAYSRRRAEVVEYCLGNKVEALRAWKRLAERVPSDGDVASSLFRLLIRKPGELVAQLAKVAAANRRDELVYLRRAVAVTESQLQDVAQAAAFARKAADSSKLTADLHDLARLRSKEGKSHAMAGIYREMASLEADDRIAVPLLQVGGLLELAAGREQEAFAVLSEGLVRVPDDLASHVVLAALYGVQSNREKRATSLAFVAANTVCEESRFTALCALAADYRNLGKSDEAREALAQATTLRPNDATLLLSLAELRSDNREWAESIALRERAAEALPDGLENSLILVEIGVIHEQQKDPTAALAAYERARTMSPDNVDVLQRCRRLYETLKRPAEQLLSLRAELELASDADRRLSLLLDIAKIAQISDESQDDVLESYEAALAIDVNNVAALGGLLAAAREGKRFQLIAKVFSAAQESVRNLEVLCEAYEELSDWEHLAAAQKRLIAVHPDPAEKTAIAARCARIYEVELKNDQGAIAALRLALEHGPSHQESYESLVRILESRGLWKDLVQALETHLASVAETPQTTSGRVELLCKIAGLRRDKLGRESEAAATYEAALALDRTNKTAIVALEKLYKSLGRNAELLRIMEVRQSSSSDDQILLNEIAQLRGSTGDVDGAVEAYFKAFDEDASNRDVFTALEKLCYSKQRWTDVMRLYGEAIASVEAGKTQAYRIGDLYSRRGQVQLQYLKAPAEAAASYTRVLEVEPANDKAMAALHELHSANSDWAALIAAYEKRAENAVDVNLKVESFRQAAEVAQTKTQNRTEAARLYQALVELNPDDLKASEMLEEFYSETKDWAQLIKVLESRHERERAAGEVSTELLKRLAKISEEGLRDDGRAVKYYEMLIELAPQNRRSLDALARIFESTERWTEFVEVTRRLVKVTKDRNVKALLYFKCGSVTEAKFGNEEDAIRYYDAAIKTSPACLPAVHGLRDLYLRREDWARVIQTLELEVKLWQDDKERAGVFAQIGRIYGDELVQPDRAMHYYECALAVDPDCVPANRALFEHYFAAEEWDRAQPLAQALAPRAMRDGDPTRRSEFYRKRGVVAAHTGDPVSAAESIVIALEIKPENVAALEALTALAAKQPGVYDFPSTFRELDKIYRKRGNSPELLARVMVGEAQVMTRAGNLHEAKLLLKKAGENSPDDLGIAEALVDLYASVRNWSKAVQVLQDFLVPGRSKDVRVAVMMRQARIYADGEMDAEQAVRVLQHILAIDAENPEVHYLLAQEFFLLERFADARRSIERVIELAAAPGSNLSAERLARYYYYLGRILDRDGDTRGSTAQYRRAADYDPGYAPPAQALAQYSMAGGDARAAETRLVNSAHAAMGQGDRESAIQLQRGLARILLKGGDRDAAIEAYRGILEVSDQGAADRLSLAEIYADSDLHKAIDETRRVIEGDLRHGPAYRVLASYYVLAGEPARAARVLSTMSLLGYSEDDDDKMLKAALAGSRSLELNQQLSTELRATLLANNALGSVVGELFSSSYQQMSQVNRKASLGDNLTPLPSIDDHALHIAVGDMVRLFGMEPEVYVGENVPGRVIAIDHPRTIVVLDRLVLQEPEHARRFALGWAFEAICGGYSSVLNLGEKQRLELANLLRSLFLLEGERSSATNDFIKGLPAGAQDIIARHEGHFQDFDMEEWMTGMNAVARRAGLLVCDDLAASARMLAVISGEDIGENYAALGTVFCGEDLFQFHISDEYDQLRSALSRVQGA